MGQDREAGETLGPDVFEGGVDLMEKMIVSKEASFISKLFIIQTAGKKEMPSEHEEGCG